MQNGTSDLMRLRWSIAACAGLVLAGALLALFARDRMQALQREEASVAEQRRGIQQRLSRATEEEQEIRQKIARYQEIARRGLIAEHGISWMLPRLIGPMNAMDLLLSARTVLAEEAGSMGLVRVLPAEGFAAAVLALEGAGADGGVGRFASVLAASSASIPAPCLPLG